SLINEQAPLQDRVGDRADQAQLERAALLVRVINRIPNLLAQRPLDGIGVADGRKLGDLRFAICDLRLVSQSPIRSAAATTLKQLPALAAVEALGHTRKGEPAGEEFGLYAEQERLLRAVQIQATGNVALAHAQGDNVHTHQLVGAQAIE